MKIALIKTMAGFIPSDPKSREFCDKVKTGQTIRSEFRTGSPVEFVVQVGPGHKLHPFSQEDKDLVAENFKVNQVVTVKARTVRKPRSWKQLATFFCACRNVADNCEDPNWNTKEKVYNSVRLAIGFYRNDEAVVTGGGTVWFPLRSVSYRELKHLEACRFFDRAFEVMAAKIGITVEELLEEANRE